MKTALESSKRWKQAGDFSLENWKLEEAKNLWEYTFKALNICLAMQKGLVFYLLV